ncbi:MAG: urease accessory protein UreE [Alphaproteobacteria bacterium]|nr:MAG: urease accessory protein UreE [Alphaproteobacteria bacterium]
MKRVSEIRRAGASGPVVDRVVLDADDRQRRRIVLTSDEGTKLLLDFPSPVTLHDGDALVLDDGSLIAVAGRAEPLIEVSAKTPLDLVRLAWHIGNRHTDIQFVAQAFRIRHDHVLEEMVRGLGGVIKAIEASFDPEPAAPHSHPHA